MRESQERHRTDGWPRTGQAAHISTVSFCPTVVMRWRTNSVNCAVTGMALATATSAIESGFDTFLYAEVRDDPGGAPLTVLSILARLDIDPWEEAARLAQLPGEAAARALAGLISTVPKGSATPPDCGTIATRLITLLPRTAEPENAALRVSSVGPRVNQIPTRAIAVARAVLYLLVAALLLVGPWVAVRPLASLPGKMPPAAPGMVVAAQTTRPDAF